MEHTKNTNSEETCECKNNFNQTTFMESFGKDDETVNKCNGCDYCKYDAGLMTCKKFS